jgi:FkbM family methyltransferase
MFTRALAKLSASLPSSVKYKLSKYKPFYTYVMGLRQSVVTVQTSAGVLNWKIDQLTSQEFVLGTYEPYMQKAFIENINEGFVVYDVGAHAGFHSLFCGLLVGPSGCVIAFEPNPENRSSVERQKTINSSLPLTILPFALSDQCATLKLDTSPGSSQGRVAENGDVTVEALTIDSLVSQGQIPPPQLIKIDVEGHEEQVIRGSLKTLLKYKSIILCDYNDDSTFLAVNELLSPLGYCVLEGPPVIAYKRVTE